MADAGLHEILNSSQSFQISYCPSDTSAHFECPNVNPPPLLSFCPCPALGFSISIFRFVPCACACSMACPPPPMPPMPPKAPIILAIGLLPPAPPAPACCAFCSSFIISPMKLSLTPPPVIAGLCVGITSLIFQPRGFAGGTKCSGFGCGSPSIGRSKGSVGFVGWDWR